MIGLFYNAEGDILGSISDPSFTEETNSMIYDLPIGQKITKIDTSVTPHQPILEETEIPADVYKELKSRLDALEATAENTTDNVSEVYDALCDIDERVYTLEESNNAVEE